MAKLERSVRENFDSLLERLTDGILNASATASLEEASDFGTQGGARCSVRVFERYSAMGGNRVSLNLTLFLPSPESAVQISAVTSGGSQAMLFKFNTLGESAFLETLESLL